MSGRSTTDGRMLGKSTNMEPGSTEARLWSRSLACSKAGSECGASAAHGAGRRPAQLTGVMGDGTPWPPKTLETSVKGARLLSPLALLAASAPARARNASRSLPCLSLRLYSILPLSGAPAPVALREPGPNTTEARRLSGALGRGLGAPALGTSCADERLPGAVLLLRPTRRFIAPGAPAALKLMCVHRTITRLVQILRSKTI